MKAAVWRCLPAVLLLFCAGAGAQQAQPFEPWVGLPGKDVIWLPAELLTVNRMMDLAKVAPGDVVMDLGSGDGRVVIGAAKRGARGIGVEYNPELVEHSRRNAAKEGVADRVTFERGDLFEADLTRATVITLFLLPEINVKLRAKLLALRPGTRIISNSFPMGDWKPDQTAWDEAMGAGCDFNCIGYLWVIPVRAAGAWQTSAGDMALEQTFQELTGTLGGMKVAGRVLGDRIRLSGPGLEYNGRLIGDAIEGTVKGEKNGAWSAKRKPD